VPCEFDGACVTQSVWQEAALHLDDFFATLTLHSLCERGEQLGVKKEREQRLMYHI
jgi:Rrf2 family transcriptional regulator, iron-sulfur cluster assembly transcription factor